MNNELGNVFAKSAEYTIYSMGTEETGLYFACVPNELKGSISIFIDLNKKGDLELYKDVKDPLKKEELLNKLNEVNKFVNGMNKSGIYAMPLIDTRLLESKLDETTRTADYNTVFKMITTCTREISEKLNSVKTGNQTIEQAIKIIEQTESDKEFISWLKKQFPTFVASVTLDDLRKQYYIELGMQSETQNRSYTETINNTLVESSQSLNNQQIAANAVNNVNAGNSVERTSDSIQSSVMGQPQNITNNNQMTTPEPIAMTSQPINAEIPKTNTGIPPVDHTYDEMAYQQQREMPKTKTLARNIARAGFVKFPVFLLTIMSIGAFGVFIGKMIFQFLSQR